MRYGLNWTRIIVVAVKSAWAQKPCPPYYTFFITLLSGCDGNKAASSVPPAQTTSTTQIQNKPEVQQVTAYDVVSKEAKGFTVGSMLITNTVYVLFDPQCPHCAILWKASIPLQNKVKFVWVPVALLNESSKPQGAAILSAVDSLTAMSMHEESLLARKGGIVPPANVSPELDAAITKNTDLMQTIGTTSVPFIIAKHAKTGVVITNAGSLSTEDLAVFLGVN